MSDEICGDVCASDAGGEFPCVREPGHDGSHLDAQAATWAQPRARYFIATRKHGFVGNAVIFWCPDSKGYTVNLEDAGEYEEAEARDIVSDATSGECRMLLVGDVRKLSRTYFDAQDMPKIGGWTP